MISSFKKPQAVVASDEFYDSLTFNAQLIRVRLVKRESCLFIDKIQQNGRTEKQA